MQKYSLIDKIKLSEDILELRDKYLSFGIPTMKKQTLNEYVLHLSIKNPKNVLEIGTATGVSGIVALKTLPNATLTTIEKDEDSFITAKENFQKFGVSDRVKQYLGDAGECLNYLDGSFDFVFLDGAKSHYIDYLFDIKRLMASSAVLFADNVLFRGYVDGGVPFGRGDNTIVHNMRKFLDAVIFDEQFISSVYEIGDGILLAQKI